ncbi:HD-GYP domain-containing protein [Paenibacillus alkalitolerans]|uniref:HD-GYP domain-containing protein n=1 Tax=Paenibacillus alkalitolerans TaxID=2799335 RepID=UPI0018F767FE|nr:HD domain-containing phosphohydrolase [Paenibacillus alkalitolerans]
MPHSYVIDSTEGYYQHVLDFIASDVCSFLMKRLCSHHLPTYHHSLRVAMYSFSIADKVGFNEQEKEILLRSALLHDIGKLMVPHTILEKKEELQPQELEIIRGHSYLGVEMLRDLINEELVDSDIIMYHHENLDGSGYPLGKREKDLSLLVRIVRVVDSYDRMTWNRGYNVPRTSEEALTELYRWNDVCYDGRIVRCFHKILAEA